jgi:hypothetical protein
MTLNAKPGAARALRAARPPRLTLTITSTPPAGRLPLSPPAVPVRCRGATARGAGGDRRDTMPGPVTAPPQTWCNLVPHIPPQMTHVRGAHGPVHADTSRCTRQETAPPDPDD